ncbi:hypothetical protein BJX76DRAFT_333672 [Aspergillus varians]
MTGIESPRSSVCAIAFAFLLERRRSLHCLTPFLSQRYRLESIQPHGKGLMKMMDPRACGHWMDEAYFLRMRKSVGHPAAKVHIMTAAVT